MKWTLIQRYLSQLTKKLTMITSIELLDVETRVKHHILVVKTKSRNFIARVGELNPVFFEVFAQIKKLKNNILKTLQAIFIIGYAAFLILFVKQASKFFKK